MVIPRLENTIKYVLSELDEMDREEFFRRVMTGFSQSLANIYARLKKVQGKKKRDLAARDAAKEADDADADDAEEGSKVAPPTAIDDEVSGDLLSSKDEDVIF